MDDGRLIGTPIEIELALKSILKLGPDLGLFLNKSKSKIIPLGKTPMETMRTYGLPIVHAEGLIVLGSTVGDQSFCNEFVEQITDEIGEVLFKIALLNDTQSQYLML